VFIEKGMSIKRLKAEKLEKGTQVIEGILDWGACQAPSSTGLKAVGGFGSLCGVVSNVMGCK
jgi:hypothetical protein